MVDADGQRLFGGALAAGVSRRTIADIIVTSPEAEQDLVRSFYQTYLHRSADNDGLSIFANALRVGASDQDVIAALIGSDEYLASAL